MRSYTEAAARANVKLCNGMTAARIIDLSDYDHERGTIVGDTLHWQDRRVRRAGLFHFCVLVAIMRATDLSLGYKAPRWSGQPWWQQVYFETVGAYRVGLEIGVRFRRDEMADRKMIVRARLLTTHIRPHDQALAAKVADWARRQ